MPRRSKTITMISDVSATASPQLPFPRLDTPIGTDPISNRATKHTRQPNSNFNGISRSIPKGDNAVPKPMGCESTETLKQDLAALGFTAIEVKVMIARQPSFEVDATAQRPHGHKAVELDQQAKREKREGIRARKGPKYEPLHLVQGSNWALFDPLQGYPAGAATPPEIFERYASYAAGNRRILEVNTLSQSVRIASTPQVLEAKVVEYTKAGPRLVDIKRKGMVKDSSRAMKAAEKRMVNASGIRGQRQRDSSNGDEVDGAADI